MWDLQIGDNARAGAGNCEVQNFGISAAAPQVHLSQCQGCTQIQLPEVCSYNMPLIYSFISLHTPNERAIYF